MACHKCLQINIYSNSLSCSNSLCGYLPAVPFASCPIKQIVQVPERLAPLMDSGVDIIFMRGERKLDDARSFPRRAVPLREAV